MEFLRRSARHSRLQKIRNTVIRKEINVKYSVTDYVTYKQLNWYGHIRRMPEERVLRSAWERCPPGRRGRGRPRNTWMQEIMMGMKTKGLEEEDWNDRDEWRIKMKLYAHNCNSVHK